LFGEVLMMMFALFVNIFACLAIFHQMQINTAEINKLIKKIDELNHIIEKSRFIVEKLK